MKSKMGKGFLLFLSVLMLMASGGTADAMRFDVGKDTAVDCDVTVVYGAGFRVKKPESAKLGEYNPAAINSDDGNENFDQWDMINNRFSTIADIDVKHKNFGVFLRPRAFYDFVYMGKNSNDSPATNNNFQAGVIDSTDDFDEETEDAIGKKAEILDLFAYAQLELVGRKLDLRVGRQVIQWGESLYLQGGIASAMAHQDASLSTAPGVEIKEMLLPSEAVSMQMDITENVSVGSFYQWKWEKLRYYESGSYFSTTDFLDEAGYLILGRGLTRGTDDEASDSGQFGVSLMYLAEWLNNTEFGIYYINYHEKSPAVAYGPNKTYYLTFNAVSLRNLNALIL
ncbi:MAG: DUF1302 family protein [Desulfobacterales bacterium]|jgi:hypothetical protein|nr:DUF1302 family protein [Desulfobacterales bacterium]